MPVSPQTSLDAYFGWSSGWATSLGFGMDLRTSIGGMDSQLSAYRRMGGTCVTIIWPTGPARKGRPLRPWPRNSADPMAWIEHRKAARTFYVRWCYRGATLADGPHQNRALAAAKRSIDVKYGRQPRAKKNGPRPTHALSWQLVVDA